MTIAFLATVQESCSIKPELLIGVDRVFSSIPEYMVFPTLTYFCHPTCDFSIRSIASKT